MHVTINYLVIINDQYLQLPTYFFKLSQFIKIEARYNKHIGKIRINCLMWILYRISHSLFSR